MFAEFARKVCSFALFEAESCFIDQADLKLTELYLPLALPFSFLKSHTTRQEGLLEVFLVLPGERKALFLKKKFWSMRTFPPSRRGRYWGQGQIDLQRANPVLVARKYP